MIIFVSFRPYCDDAEGPLFPDKLPELIITLGTLYHDNLLYLGPSPLGEQLCHSGGIVGWTPEDFHLAIMGSIFGIVMEICKVTCVRGCKACLLVLYFSMT